MFLQNGTWVPDQVANGMNFNGAGSSSVVPMSNTRQMLNQPQQPYFPVNNGFNQQPVAAADIYTNAQQQPVAPQTLSSQMNAIRGLASKQGMTYQDRPMYQPTQQQLGRAQPVNMGAQPVNTTGAVLPNGPPDGGNQQFTSGYQNIPQQQQGFYPQQQQQPRPQQSVMQGVNNNNPQSVQNFLQALNQSNVSGSNAWQNPQGMQGQGPQAGFQGFQQNSQPNYQPTQWQGYNQGQQQQLGSYSNQAQEGSPLNKGYKNNQNAGVGGIPGQNQAATTQQNPQVVTQQQNLNKATDNSGKIITNNNTVATSDVDAKTNIKSAESELQDFLNNLGVYSYEYKDPKNGEGRRISPMAQEIEKTDLGKIAISTNAEGYKQVDYGKLMGTQLAALSLLNHKYNELEKQLKKAVKDNLNKKRSSK